MQSAHRVITALNEYTASRSAKMHGTITVLYMNVSVFTLRIFKNLSSRTIFRMTE